LLVTGTPVPSMTAYSLSGAGSGGSGMTLRRAIRRAWPREAAARAAPLASADRSTRLTVRRIPARSSSSPAARANGTAAPGHPGLVALPAVRPRPPVAGVGGQQLPEHPAAHLQQPGADHRLSRQAAYLGGLLLREGLEEPPFSPPGAEGASAPASGRASQILSFTSMICSTVAVNSAFRASSARTLPTSAAAS
jgi:hypothetical protein